MRLFKVGVLAAAVLGACCAAAAAKVPRVVTDMPVVHALVTQVMGDLGPVDLLLDRGGDVHSYQMRPSQAQALAAADVVFWVGPELTPWLVRVRETLAIKVVGALLIAAMLLIPANAARPFARTPEAMALGSVLMGILATLGGLWLSLNADTPAGPSIVGVAAGLFLVAVIFSAAWSQRRPADRR